MQDTRYGWPYLLGAVCPERAVGAGLVMPRANTEVLNRHLVEISKTVATGAPAAPVVNGPGWRGSDKLRAPDNISLVKLPPSAPEFVSAQPGAGLWHPHGVLRMAAQASMPERAAMPTTDLTLAKRSAPHSERKPPVPILSVAVGRSSRPEPLLSGCASGWIRKVKRALRT